MLLLPRLLLGSVIIFCPFGLGNAADSPALPLGTVLNDQGQPISIPNQATSNFNYSPPSSKHASQTPSSQQKSAKQTQSKKSKAKKGKTNNRKQQLASRNSVANDPSCRWLNSRMTSLERNLRNGISARNRHYQQELDNRQQEWQCMKCGAEGPEQTDYAACQYRR